MINLLNPEDIKQIRAARLNMQLRGFVMLTAVIALGVASIYGVGFWFASQERAVANEQHTAAQTKLKDYEVVKDEAANYRKNLAVAQAILAKEIIFSEFLTNTASILPPNTILSELNLSTKVASGAKKLGSMSLQARAKSYNDVLRLKDSLEASPLFSDVRIAQANVLEKPATSGIEVSYPYEATYDVIVEQLAKATTK